MSTTRRKFSGFNDWYDFLGELRAKQPPPEVNFYALRQGCFQEIEQLRGRPLLVYVARFPGPQNAPTHIDLEDLDGFTDLVNAIDPSKSSVDILLHSPGGSAEATERIVELLRVRFQDVTFLIPHSAYSAATMLALSGNEIILNPEASLGPIDPQIGGVPARALKRGFEKARQALRESGPDSLPAYVPLIEKYSLEILEICEDYEQLSRVLVTQWLTEYMFAGVADAAQKIDDAVKFFSDYDTHHTHSRSLTLPKISHLGLNVKAADDSLRMLMREAHILLTGFMGISPFVKLYENSTGLSWGRQFQQVPLGQSGPNPPTSAVEKGGDVR